MTLLLVLLGQASAQALDSKVRIVDVQAFRAAGVGIVSGNIVIPTSKTMFTTTVAIDGIACSAEFRESRHMKPADFIVGANILAHVEKDKLVIRDNDGKEEKAKIIRRERLK